MKIPTILTFFRLVLVPIFVVVFYLPFHWARFSCAAIFAIAAATDWLDGYLARKLNQTTEFGAFLDPVVDKIMVAFALVLLVADPHLPLIAIPAGIIVCREIVISALREWMAELGERTSVAVSYIGKIKTSTQMLAIFLLLACDPRAPGVLCYAGYLFLYVAAVLTLWSMVVYLKAASPKFKME